MEKEKKTLIYFFVILVIIFISTSVIKAYAPSEFLKALPGGIMSFLPLILILGIITLLIVLGIKVGRRIGNSMTKESGFVLGLIFIVLGIALFILSMSNLINNLDKTENIAMTLLGISVGFILGIFLFIMGISSFINSNKKTENITVKTIPEEDVKQNNDSIKENLIERILLENNLSEYIEVFKRNKLDDLNILSTINETDLEKMGIDILGDRKRLLQIFAKN